MKLYHVYRKAQKHGIFTMLFVLCLSLFSPMIMQVQAQENAQFYLSRIYDPFSMEATYTLNTTSKIALQALDVTLFYDESSQFTSFRAHQVMDKFVVAYNDKLPFEFLAAFASATSNEVEGPLFSVTFKMPSDGKASLGRLLVNDESQDIISLRNFILDTSEVVLKLSESHTIKANFIPENTSVQTLLFKSSNDAIVKVNDEGVVMAQAIGEAVIEVKSLDASVVQYLKVYVVSTTEVTKPTIPVVITPPLNPSITKVIYSIDDLPLLIKTIQDIDSDTITLLISAQNHTIPLKLFELFQTYQKNLVIQGVNLQQYPIFTLNWPYEKMRISEDAFVWLDVVKIESSDIDAFEFSWNTNIKQIDIKPVVHLNAWFSQPLLYIHKYFSTSGYSKLETIDSFDYEKGFSIYSLVIADNNLADSDQPIDMPSSTIQWGLGWFLLIGSLFVIGLGLLWRSRR
jgi:hypothetical protein